jgi:hypothetical protein
MRIVPIGGVIRLLELSIVGGDASILAIYGQADVGQSQMMAASERPDARL